MQIRCRRRKSLPLPGFSRRKLGVAPAGGPRVSPPGHTGDGRASAGCNAAPPSRSRWRPPMHEDTEAVRGAVSLYSGRFSGDDRAGRAAGREQLCMNIVVPAIVGLVLLAGLLTLALGHKGWSWGTVAAAILALLASGGYIYLAARIAERERAWTRVVRKYEADLLRERDATTLVATGEPRPIPGEKSLVALADEEARWRRVLERVDTWRGRSWKQATFAPPRADAPGTITLPEQEAPAAAEPAGAPAEGAAEGEKPARGGGAAPPINVGVRFRCSTTWCSRRGVDSWACSASWPPPSTRRRSGPRSRSRPRCRRTTPTGGRGPRPTTPSPSTRTCPSTAGWRFIGCRTRRPPPPASCPCRPRRTPRTCSPSSSGWRPISSGTGSRSRGNRRRSPQRSRPAPPPRAATGLKWSSPNPTISRQAS